MKGRIVTDRAEVVELHPQPETTEYGEEADKASTDASRYQHDHRRGKRWLLGRRILLFVVGAIVIVALMVVGDWLLGDDPGRTVVSEIPSPSLLPLSTSRTVTQLEQELHEQEVQADQLRQELAQSISGDEHQAALDKLAAVEQTVGDLESELMAKIEEVEAVEIELNRAQRIADMTQLELSQARADVAAQAANASIAEAALAAEIGLLPTRIQESLRLLATVELVGDSYYLGEVVYELVRPGIWNDETQFFEGHGFIGLSSGLFNTSAEWQGDDLVVKLPLPVVRQWQFAQIEGKTDSEREQFARWVGRWGDATEWFVDDEAKKETRKRACADVNLLREGVNSLKRLVKEMSNGHSVLIEWSDSAGNIHKQLTDEVLLDSAC